MVTADGQEIAAGDSEVPFSIQSISKVFALTLALDKVGEALWQRVGQEPSGNPFNSIVQLEYEAGKPRNPFINAGAIAMTCRQLARAGRYLARDGRLAPNGPRVTTRQRARRISALMLTCGHYDAPGEFAFRVGIPGQSGVGGGILAVVPGRAAITCWSPGLNAVGNSLLGTQALESLTTRTGWSVFAGGSA